MKPSNNGKPSKNTYYDKNKSNIFKPASPIKKPSDKAHQRTKSAPKINEANFNKILSLKDDIKHIDIKTKHDIYDDHVNMNHHKEYLSFYKGAQEKHFLVDNTKNSRYVKQESLRSNILNDPNAQSNIVLVHNPKPLQETLEINSKQKNFFRKFQENKEINPPLNEFHRKKSDLILETDWTHYQEKLTTGPNELQAAGLSSKRKMQKNLSSIIFSDEHLIKTQNGDFFHDESFKIGSGKHSTKLINKYKSERNTQEVTGLLTESCLQDKANNGSPNKEKQFFKCKVKREVFTTEYDRYEIPNNENSNFKIDDVKRNFIKNGIHIYDLMTNATNSIIFRIRKLNDNVLIKEKFNKLSEEMGEKGLKIQRYQPVYSKKCQVSGMSKYENRKRSLEIQEKNTNNKRINVDKSQKLSNNIVDTKYKRGSDKLIAKKR